MNRTLPIKLTKRETNRISVASSDQKGKRRVIKSYKTLEKEKIEKQRKYQKSQMNWMNSMKGNYTVTQDTQLKLFRLVYLPEWNEYLSLVGVEHEDLK